MRPHAIRLLTMCTATLLLAGCATWQAVPLSDGLRMIEEGELSSARLTTKNGTELVASRPLALNDSILWDDGAQGIAYEDVAFIDVKETQVLRSIGIVAGLVLLFGALTIDYCPSGC